MVCLVIGLDLQALAQPTSFKADTATVYGDIETFSKKSKFTRFVYGLVFKPVASSPAKKKLPLLLHVPYADYEGKIIRDINIVTLDPFGFSAKDTAALPQNILFRSGNALHVKTQGMTISNILLIRRNEPLDSLLAKESERLILSQSYVREVVFSFTPAGETADSVDVNIRVLDKWSIYLNGSLTSSHAAAGFTEKDFIGFGHELQNRYTWNRSTKKNALTANYYIPNVRNSHISTVLHYNSDENGNSGRSVAVERPFYSPFARWAAGLNLSQQFQKDALADALPEHQRQDIKYNIQDYWAGNANRIFKGKTENDRTTNAIVAGRYLRIRYLEKPYEMPDSFHHYANQDLYLAGLGISMRKYFRDNYIYNYGGVEYVPVGAVYGLTGGYQTIDAAGRLYLGWRTSFGNYHGWGYLSSTLEYGTFIRGRSLEQGVFAGGVNYFSNLLETGSWRIRQFVKPQVTWGAHRFSSDSLTINDENGIRGFSGSSRGTQKIVLTLQTQSYAPWNLVGFRFGPYLTGSLGMLGNAASGFKYSRVSSQLGIGALIKNEYLVLNNFQFSIAYYPSIPGSGYNIFKFNAFRTTDFGFSDFIFGKPETVPFQ
ncbi:MAG: hypothetical protein RDU76_09520 [Candidatus Edwardsbacteria bacterium]|nr:hypothetical protein [Candidatus Edwardsbacteria bacterium]